MAISMPLGAVPTSHAGRLFIDRDFDGKFFLTDTLSLESKQLPTEGGPWDVVVHPDTGRGVVFSENSDPIVVDEFMAKSVYQMCEGGDLVLVESEGGGNFRERRMSELSVRLREAKVHLQTGATKSTAELAMFVFLRERAGGSRVYVSVTGLYSVLKLDQYKGQASKWFYSQHKNWDKRLTPFLGAGHIVLSTQMLDKGQGQFESRCLPRHQPEEGIGTSSALEVDIARVSVYNPARLLGIPPGILVAVLTPGALGMAGCYLELERIGPALALQATCGNLWDERGAMCELCLQYVPRGAGCVFRICPPL